MNHKLIFGLDANTYDKFKPGKQQDVRQWGESYMAHGMSSCWGDVPQPGNYTTFNARTYLQPQLNKACKSTEKREKGDVNPKDFIVFKKNDFEVINPSDESVCALISLGSQADTDAAVSAARAALHCSFFTRKNLF